jgi:hypothetical protein
LLNCFKIIFLIFILFSWVFIGLSCDAPRSNPLDPLNQDNSLVILEGYVKSESLPREPLSGTTILFENSGLITSTDNNGYFKLDNIRSKKGWVKFNKDGFVKDSLFVDWGSDKTKSVEIFLNELPNLETISLSSVILNRYVINPIAYLSLTAKISDKDNDIDSVFVSNSDLKLKKAIEYNTIKKDYETTLLPIEIGVNDIEMVIGYSFKILVKDVKHNIFEVGQAEVKRIIKSEVLFESPKDLEVVSSLPTLKWKRFLPGFSFSYLVEIYTNETNPQLVWSKENISSNDISADVDSPLSAGNYFWVIYCIDSFNNMSRSKPASFTVE